MTIKLELTPDEIAILHHTTAAVTDFCERSQVIADALGIDRRHRKKLREIVQHIHNQGSQQARKSRLA